MTRYRPGGPDDLRTMVELCELAVSDLSARLGGPGVSATGHLDMDGRVERRRSLFEHLAATAESAWIAESDDGRPIGYARATLHDGVRELTELFVRPGEQSAGVGRELLDRTFRPDGSRRRVVIATIDGRAIARYLKAGLVGLLPIYNFSRAPERVSVATDLVAERVERADEAVLDAIADLEGEILDQRRDADHRWLAADRQLYLFRRGGTVAGYGYVGRWPGPFAARDPGDLPAMLAHAETLVAEAGWEDLAFEVPLTAGPAVAHLVGRGYRLDPFFEILLADGPFGRFDRYVLTNPPFFL